MSLILRPGTSLALKERAKILANHVIGSEHQEEPNINIEKSLKLSGAQLESITQALA